MTAATAVAVGGVEAGGKGWVDDGGLRRQGKGVRANTWRRRHTCPLAEQPRQPRLPCPLPGIVGQGGPPLKTPAASAAGGVWPTTLEHALGMKSALMLLPTMEGLATRGGVVCISLRTAPPVESSGASKVVVPSGLSSAAMAESRPSARAAAASAEAALSILVQNLRPSSGKRTAEHRTQHPTHWLHRHKRAGARQPGACRRILPPWRIGGGGLTCVAGLLLPDGRGGVLDAGDGGSPHAALGPAAAPPAIVHRLSGPVLIRWRAARVLHPAAADTHPLAAAHRVQLLCVCHRHHTAAVGPVHGQKAAGERRGPAGTSSQSCAPW